MAESVDNLEDILRNWAKGKVQKMPCQGIEQVREAWRRNIKPFLLENDLEKLFEQSQSAVERD